jgi:hypothetical protein
MEGCPACRAEAESLRAVATLVTRVDPARIEGSPPATPAGLGRRVETLIRAERRTSQQRFRLRLGLGLAGAASLAAAAVLALGILGSSDSSARDVEFTSLPAGVHISAELEPRSVGTRIGISVEGLRPGVLCRVELRSEKGQPVQAGSFRYRYQEGEDNTAVLTSALPAADATAIAVHAGRQTFVQPLQPNAAS